MKEQPNRKSVWTPPALDEPEKAGDPVPKSADLKAANYFEDVLGRKIFNLQEYPANKAATTKAEIGDVRTAINLYVFELQKLLVAVEKAKRDGKLDGYETANAAYRLKLAEDTTGKGFRITKLRPRFDSNNSLKISKDSDRDGSFNQIPGQEVEVVPLEFVAEVLNVSALLSSSYSISSSPPIY